MIETRSDRKSQQKLFIFTYVHKLQSSLEFCQTVKHKILAIKAQLTITQTGIELPPSPSQFTEERDQFYDILAFGEVQKDDLRKIEQSIQSELERLQTEQTTYEELYQLPSN